MKHITHLSDDVPATTFLMDRRSKPSRRAVWRGGRRDSDWTGRPLGGWERMHEPPRGSAIKRMLATLHLW